jgi:hypothetical protein
MWELWENFTNVEDLDKFEREFGTDDGVGDPVGAYTGPRIGPKGCRQAMVSAMEEASNWYQRCMSIVSCICPPTLPSLVPHSG